MSMFTKFFKKIRHKAKSPLEIEQEKNDLSKKLLDNDLPKNIQMIKNTTGNSSDIIIRHLAIGKNSSIKAAVIFTDGLVNDQTINDYIIEAFIHDPRLKEDQTFEKILDILEKEIIPIDHIQSIYDWDSLFSSLFSGDTILLVDGYEKALSFSTRGGEKRAVLEPSTEASIRGPRDSFTESIRTNTSLIRRRIKNPNLWLESMKIGKVSQTDVAIMYIKGIANDQIVKEVKSRLEKINVDHILESGYIEELIEDQTFTFFPTIFHTERPDVASANLLEGRIAILIDGTPYVLTAPAVFVEFFQAADDYYSRFDLTIALRFLRVLIFFISIIGPASYIAVTTFHQEMIPTTLIIAIAAQREAIPFPAFVEALIMEITFEILREAGVRLPKTIGQAVSIVGALVIGQAAVQASIVSPAMVIVVAITAISSFATPAFSIAISARLIRFLLMILASFIGFFGIICGLMIMTIHLCSLRSFGIPYMSPIAPIIFSKLRDTIVRFPIWGLKDSGQFVNQKNIKETSPKQKPTP